MLSSSDNRIRQISFDRFWTSNGKNKQRTLCACLVTSFIFLLVMALFIYQLINMFSMKTVFSKTLTTYLNEPPYTIMSTRAANSTNSPFMMAFSILYNNCSTTGTISTEASYFVKSPTATSQSPIQLETCTKEHFSLIPGGTDKIRQFTTNSLRCLPLNSDFQIGGSTTVSGIERYLNLKFTCPSTCTSTCGTVELFAQNAKPDPDDKDNSMNYFIQRKAFLVQNPTTYENSYVLDENVLQKDDSILFGKTHESKSFTGGVFYNDLITSNSSTTTLSLKRSDRTIYTERYFLKMFDVFAYIGGLTQAAFLLFFFMPSFCRYLFQMKFSQVVFKHRQTKDVSFISYIKQTYFDSTSGTSIQPQWQLQKKRKTMKQAAGKLLDTIYLYRRIAFLEEAISILLERHQLKGLHLIHSLTEEEANRRHESHRFRDRVVYFLGKYKKAVGDVDRMATDMPPQSNQYMKDLQSNKMSEDNLASSNGVMANQLIELKKKSTSKGILHQAQHSQDDYRNQEQRRKDEQHLQEQIDLIGKMGEEELNEAALTEELETDLQRLLDEGRTLQGDERSKKICEKLQGWLKSGMEIATKQYKKQHHHIIHNGQNINQ